MEAPGFPVSSTASSAYRDSVTSPFQVWNLFCLQLNVLESPTIESKLSPGQGQEAPIRMRTELNALEGPISKCTQNLRNCSSPSGGPRDKPLNLSKNSPRGRSPCSALSGILGHKLELVNKPSCVCFGVGFSMVFRIRNLGHNSLR